MRQDLQYGHNKSDRMHLQYGHKKSDRTYSMNIRNQTGLKV